MLCCERISRRGKKLVMVSIQLFGASSDRSRRPVPRKAMRQERRLPEANCRIFPHGRARAVRPRNLQNLVAALGNRVNAARRGLVRSRTSVLPVLHHCSPAPPGHRSWRPPIRNQANRLAGAQSASRICQASSARPAVSRRCAILAAIVGTFLTGSSYCAMNASTSP